MTKKVRWKRKQGKKEKRRGKERKREGGEGREGREEVPYMRLAYCINFFRNNLVSADSSDFCCMLLYIK